MTFRSFIFILLSLSAIGGEVSPSKAVEFVDRLRFQDEVEWGDFLFSEHLDKAHQADIKERVQAQISSQLQKHYHFELLEQKVDSDIGGAVLRVVDKNQPMFLRVITLAFCKVDGSWKCTPELGRFLYTGFKRFDVDAERRQVKMENWLFGRRKHYLEVLELQIEASFKAKVLAKLDKKSALFGESKMNAVLYFLKLCREKDYYGVAACLGLDGVIPASESDSIRLALSDGIGGGKLSGGWERIVDRAFLMEPLKSVDDDNGRASLAMYYPSGRNQSQIFECEAVLKKGRWVVQLPNDMQLNRSGSFTGAAFRSWRLAKGNRDRLDEVPDIIMKGLGKKRAESAEKAVGFLKDALEKIDMRQWCLYADYEGKDTGSRVKVLESYLAIWSKLRQSSTMMFKVFDVEEDGDVAMCRLLAFSKTRPNVYDIHRLIFMKDADGWYQVTTYQLEKLDAQDAKKLSYEKLETSASGNEKELRGEIAAGLMGEAKLVGQGDGADFVVPAKGKLMEVYKDYEGALKQGEFMEGLKHVAVLKGNETELLASVGADLRGRSDHDAKYEVLAEYVSGKLGGVTVRISNARTTDSEYVMYGIHQVGKRYYVMPTLLYRYEFGRGDRLLNEDLLDSYKEVFEGFYQESVKGLIEKHTKFVDGILKKKE